MKVRPCNNHANYFLRHAIKPVVVASYLTVVFIIHVLLATTLSLGDDESYYWQWAKHLALSYYDHPPLIAYLIAGSTYVFGDNLFAVRFFNLVLFLGTAILVYMITTHIYGKTKNINFLALVLFTVMPLFALGALLVAPDVPMIFCYALGIYLFWQIVNYNKANYWYLLGVVAGIGMLAKYTMLFFYLGVLLYLLYLLYLRRLSHLAANWFVNYRVYLAFLISWFIFLPVFWWNKQHHYVSFIFQFYSRHSHSLHFNAWSLMSFIASQILLLAPFIFYLAVVIIYKIPLKLVINTKNKPHNYNATNDSCSAMGAKYSSCDLVVHNNLAMNNVFLLCFIAPPLIVFTLVAAFFAFKPTWADMCYLPLVILLAGNSYLVSNKLIKLAIISSVVLALLVIVQAYYPYIRIKPLSNDSTNDFYGWNKVAVVVQKFMQDKMQDTHSVDAKSGHFTSLRGNNALNDKTNTTWFLFSHNYQLSSQLAYAIRNQYPVYSLDNKLDGYFFWQNESDIIGKNGLFVATTFYNLNPRLRYKCEHLFPYKTIDILRHQLLVRQVFLYECINYQGRVNE